MKIDAVLKVDMVLSAPALSPADAKDVLLACFDQSRYEVHAIYRSTQGEAEVSTPELPGSEYLRFEYSFSVFLLERGGER